ncbi:MAG TPA: hotdog fold thioesterase [Acidimicrobiales bacterium]|nr:hotdog fold thioesterase [Acidimicrobiales bacterium]
MGERHPTAIGVVSAFVDAVNRGDVDGLAALMSDEHELRVFDEPPLVGRGPNVEGWRDYIEAFPAYRIVPHAMAERDGTVAVVGHTTGSHLRLPDEEERRLSLIWLADVVDGAVCCWHLVPDDDENRRAHGLPSRDAGAGRPTADDHIERTERTGPFWDVMAGRAPGPPAAATLGWELRAVDPDRGTIEVGYAATEAFTNPMGNVQGGFLAAMLDDTLGPALVATLGPGQFAPTLELKVSFLRPARPGRYVGRGRVVHRGGTVAFLEGTLADADGVVVATASATARIVKVELPGA